MRTRAAAKKEAEAHRLLQGKNSSSAVLRAVAASSNRGWADVLPDGALHRIRGHLDGPDAGVFDQAMAPRWPASIGRFLQYVLRVERALRVKRARSAQLPPAPPPPHGVTVATHGDGRTFVVADSQHTAPGRPQDALEHPSRFEATVDATGTHVAMSFPGRGPRPAGFFKVSLARAAGQPRWRAQVTADPGAWMYQRLGDDRPILVELAMRVDKALGGAVDFQADSLLYDDPDERRLVRAFLARLERLQR